MTGQQAYPVVIADDHEIIRTALRGALTAAGEFNGISYCIEVVAEAANGREALDAVRVHRPSAIVLDISMPDISGHEIIADIRRWSPDTKIIVFTGVTAPGLLSVLYEGGVEGLFSKSASANELIENFPRILSGQRALAESLQAIVRVKSEVRHLSKREQQVLALLVAGKSNREVAQTLCISHKTVEKHRASLMQKLNVGSLAQLLTLAVREGLVDLSIEL